MSYQLDAVVPPAVRRALEAEPATDDGFTILVLSSAAGWPHLAMVSGGELICADDRLLLLALWPTSTACANVSDTRRATLCAVIEGVAYSLRVTGRRLADISTPMAGTLACFGLEVDSVFGDQAPYAELESGVRFRLLDPDTTVARWIETRAALASLVDDL
jgi:hypothetical protein